jgi:hypothetical protein
VHIPFFKRLLGERILWPSRSTTLPSTCSECSGTIRLTLVEPFSENAKLDQAIYTCANCGKEEKAFIHRGKKTAIKPYLSDPSITKEVASAMSEAYDSACLALEISSKKFSPRAVATLIANFAHDGEHNPTRLVDAVLAALPPRNTDDR